MQLKRYSSPSDCSDRSAGLQATISRCSLIPSDLLPKALLGDRWAIELQSNGITKADFDSLGANLQAHYDARGIDVHLEKIRDDVYVIVGNLNQLRQASEAEEVQLPLDSDCFQQLMNYWDQAKLKVAKHEHD